MKADGYRRLVKFCLVGIAGIGIQLGVLSLLQQWKVEYLAATAIAVECAVVHNFLWHRRFTWVDRVRPGALEFFVSLFRFHLSNGFISLVGNVLLMRLLSGTLRVPVLPANLSAITVCFAANFLASDCWVFRVV
jgi:putative flippase GtrA